MSVRSFGTPRSSQAVDRVRRNSDSNPGDVPMPQPPIFNERLKHSLSVIDECRRLGLDKEVQLPAVVVIGDQSVGKSSVLEHISGVSLPRGTGIVTRCPIQLSMRRSTGSSAAAGWSGNIAFNTLEGARKVAEIENPGDVGRAILAAQRMMTKNETDMSSEPIELLIESPQSPDLTLIDLPGIVRVSNFSASSSKMTDAQRYQQIRDLIFSYICRDEVIILVVIPAHDDIETIGALALAREADPDLRRTIGVVTRPDLLNPGSENQIIELVTNKRVVLEKGFVVVKCRSQEDIDNNRTLKDSLRSEVVFFMSNPRFRKLPQDCVGTWTLATKLTTELYAAIQKFLPEILKDVRHRILEIRQEQDSLGCGVPGTDAQKVRLLMQLLIRFTDEFRRMATGVYLHESKENHLYSLCRQRMTEFAEVVDGLLLKPEDTDLWQEMYKEVIDRRGGELPMFLSYYPLCERLIKKRFIEKVKEPSRDVLADVDNEVDRVLLNLCQQHFVDFPRLVAYVKDETKTLRQEFCRSANEDLERLFEMENIIWTQDRTFLSEMNSAKNNSSRTESDQGEDDASPASAEIKRMFHGLQIKGADDILHGSRIYIEVAAKRVMDMVPLVIMHNLLMKLSDKVQCHILAEAATKQKNMLELLEEDDIIIARRKDLSSQLDQWSLALKKLSQL